jgi:hypothetical protein
MNECCATVGVRGVLFATTDSLFVTPLTSGSMGRPVDQLCDMHITVKNAACTTRETFSLSKPTTGYTQDAIIPSA